MSGGRESTGMTLRALDLVAATTGLLVLSPVLAVTAVMVKVTSPGPAFFVQPRVGRKERRFHCIKFRTMAVGAPVAGTHEVSASYVTALGRTLRRFKIDELPQLLNVLRGEMSIVGPRPCLPSQVELIEERRKRGVFEARPGITGPAQVKGVDMSVPAELAELDQTWVRRPTLGGYVTCIFQTLIGGGSGDRVRE